jgi:hypothetical protein
MRELGSRLGKPWIGQIDTRRGSRLRGQQNRQKKTNH